MTETLSQPKKDVPHGPPVEDLLPFFVENLTPAEQDILLIMPLANGDTVGRIHQISPFKEQPSTRVTARALRQLFEHGLVTRERTRRTPYRYYLRDEYLVPIQELIINWPPVTEVTTEARIAVTHGIASLSRIEGFIYSSLESLIVGSKTELNQNTFAQPKVRGSSLSYKLFEFPQPLLPRDRAMYLISTLFFLPSSLNMSQTNWPLLALVEAAHNDHGVDPQVIAAKLANASSGVAPYLGSQVHFDENQKQLSSPEIAERFLQQWNNLQASKEQVETILWGDLHQMGARRLEKTIKQLQSIQTDIIETEWEEPIRIAIELLTGVVSSMQTVPPSAT